MADQHNEPNSYWRSPGELKGEARVDALKSGEFSAEAAEVPGMPTDGLSRRRFLGLLGASAALAATGSSCTRDIDRGSIVPYTRRPPEATPGIATYYASSWSEGLSSESLLIKTREARPVLIEGNDSHAATGGSVSARAQAELLSLYDPQRLREPTRNGQPVDWAAAEDALGSAISGRCLLLTEAVQSPSRQALIDALKQAYPGLQHRSWEPAAPHGAIAAAREVLGGEFVPSLHLDKARVILALEADLLGGEGEGVSQIRGYAAGRQLLNRADAARGVNRLWAVESRMTLTGGKSDERIQLRASRLAALAFAIAHELHHAHGIMLPAGMDAAPLARTTLKSFAAAEGLDLHRLEALVLDLKTHGAKALVVAGNVLPAEAHAATILLNRMLGAEGTTLSYRPAALSPLLSPAEFVALQREMAGGRFGGLVLWLGDPAHSSPAGSDWSKAMAGVTQRVHLGLLPDGSATACEWSLPIHHWLEAWGDQQGGLLQQPAVAPLYETRQAEDLLLGLLDGKPATMEAWLKERWTAEWNSRRSPVPFKAFWNGILHDGFAEGIATAVKGVPLKVSRLNGYMNDATWNPKGGLELVLFADRRLYDGRHANNGWLQELPDPVTKCTWGNPVSIAPADARQQGLKDGDLVTLSLNGVSVEAVTHIQPGQAPGTASMALGYGREGLDVAAGIGVNVYPLMAGPRPQLQAGVQLAKSLSEGRTHTTQEHHLMEGRDLVRSLPLAAYLHGENGGPHHGGHGKTDALKTGQDHGAAPDKNHEPSSLYPTFEYNGHKWGMAIDLTSCVGCASCVIACQSENNIPSVGPDRVDEGREMHWIRIDRYYEGDIEDPDMVFQPMLCQHCDHAPCENVCPVAATTHNEEGLNQMTYNRCVGTRYCANNCPYKVRRFNYFDYTGGLADTLQLAQNPEVSIRPRGVMEKCTFCVQRINNAKSQAKADGRDIRDGDVTAACASACPARAITFGDLNDDHSQVAAMAASDRSYGVLADLGVRPAISYLAEVKNPALPGGAHES